MPQLLPKPKSSASPKPGRATPKRDVVSSADLLGTTATPKAPEVLPQSAAADDVFSSFLSAPQIVQEPSKNIVESKATDLKSEEESFFNQPAPSEKEKSKMTKDSILALYGQKPQNIGGQFPQQNGMFQTGFQQQPFPQTNPAFAQAFTNFPAHNAFNTVPVANTMPQTFISNFSQYPPPVGMSNTFNNQFSSSQSQFTSLPNFPAPNSSQFQTTPQFQNTNGAFHANSMNGAQSFFPAPSGNAMAQQFGNMSLGQNVQPPMNAFPAQQSNTMSLSGKPQPNVAANGAWP